jgi:hypothetical protein
VVGPDRALAQRPRDEEGERAVDPEIQALFEFGRLERSLIGGEPVARRLEILSG